MKFTVSKSALLRELQIIAGVAEKKSTIPVLAYLALESTTTGLHIKATDLDVSLTTHCEANVDTPGALCLNGRKLLDIVKGLPDAEVSIAVDGQQATIKCERSRFKIGGLSVESYPELAKAPEREEVILPAATLRKLISSTFFAITQEESRYTLNGAKLEIGVHSGETRMVATDGHRLSFVSTANTSTQVIDALIPRKTLAELAKLTADETGDVGLILHESTLYFRIGKRLLTSRTLSGQFPQYQQVLPKEFNGAVSLPVATLAAAVRRVSLMADERSKAIQVQIADQSLTVLAPASENGEASEQLAIEYSGPDVIFSVNATYLLDTLSVLDGEAVIQFKNGQSQIEVRPKESAGFTYRGIIMPMRTA